MEKHKKHSQAVSATTFQSLKKKKKNVGAVQDCAKNKYKSPLTIKISSSLTKHLL